MSFRENLQHLRAQRNMTQEQLAMLLGVSRQSVTKWEAERSYPEMDKLLKMCEIFSCSLDDLVKGDLTEKAAAPGAVALPTVPAGPPQDICGYDEHQLMMAKKIPAGIACILVFVALGFFSEGAFGLAPWNKDSILFIVFVLVGVLCGLALFIPAGMAHSSFVKAHPFVEDFYTEDDKTQARSAFARGLVLGIALIFAGAGCLFALEEIAEYYAMSLALMFIAAGVWFIVRYGMLFGRTNIAEYNQNAVGELEIEDIEGAQVSTEAKNVLFRQREQGKKRNAICDSIMIVSTIVGLALLFVPVFSSPDPSHFEPAGTSAVWFWVAWPIGGMLCGVVSLIWKAFGEK